MERFPHTYKKCFVLLSNQCEISQYFVVSEVALYAILYLVID